MANNDVAIGSTGLLSESRDIGGGVREQLTQGGYTAPVIGSTLQRPGNTTLYDPGDLVANSATAVSVVPISFVVGRLAGVANSGLIRGARLVTSSISLTNAQFWLHLFSSSPTVANGDNGAFLPNNAANYLGAIDITLDRAFSDGAVGWGAPRIVSEIAFAVAAQTIYGLPEVRLAYPPTSGGTFIFALNVQQD